MNNIERVPHPPVEELFKCLYDESAILIDSRGWCVGDLAYMSQMYGLNTQQQIHFEHALLGPMEVICPSVELTFEVKCIYVNGEDVFKRVESVIAERYPDAQVIIMTVDHALPNTPTTSIKEPD